MKKQIKALNEFFPIDISNPSNMLKWQSISKQSTMNSIRVINDSIFDIIKLNSCNYKKFLEDAESAVKTLEDPFSDLFVSISLSK